MFLVRIEIKVGVCAVTICQKLVLTKWGGTICHHVNSEGLGEWILHSVRCHWVIYTVTALTVDLSTCFWLNRNFVGQFALGCMHCFCSKAVFVIFNGYCNKKNIMRNSTDFHSRSLKTCLAIRSFVGSNPRWVDISRLTGCSEICAQIMNGTKHWIKSRLQTFEYLCWPTYF